MSTDPVAPKDSSNQAEATPVRTPSPAETPSTGQGQTVAPPGSLAIEIYSLVLFVGIFAYFGFLFFLGGLAVRWVYKLIPLELDLSLATAVRLFGIVILAVFAIRITAHIVYAMAGLVTQVNDNVPEAEAGVPLDRDQQPQLHQLVADLAKQLNAPQPDEIRLTYLAECYTVELRKFGLRTQRRLIMALGMPHISVCTVAELRVIVGHELAHVSRGDTRLTVFIARFLESLNRSIEAMKGQSWRWLDPVYLVQRLYYQLMARASAPVQRYQELRADAISAATSGGELAARTLLKDWLLHHQFVTAAASYDPNAPTANGTVDLDIFSSFATKWHDFSPAGQDYLLGRLAMQENRSFWDPYPTTVERVREMQSYPPVDFPEAEVRARELLNNYNELAEVLHEAMYDDHIGLGLFDSPSSTSGDAV